MNRLIVLVLALVLAPPVVAAQLHGRFEQGGLVLGQAQPGADIRLDGHTVPVDDQGYFLLGFSRDAEPKAVLRINGTEQILEIAKRDWPVQRIDGLPPTKVTPDPAQLARIQTESQLIASRRERVSSVAWFMTGLVTPADGIVSGVFGSQRILNGQARAPHSGTDIAAGLGAPVHAVGDGIVTLAQPDLYFTGQTVMIDHGLGLQSVYAHLSRTDVHEGDIVHQGQVIGAVGASGRATGPHLHWGASWLNVRLDPQSVLAVLGKP